MRASTIRFVVDLIERRDLTVCVLPGNLLAAVSAGVGRC